MLAYRDALAAALELIRTRFPGETYYNGFLPADYSRPSFLAELVSTELLDASATSIEVTLTIKITAYVDVGEQSEPDSRAAELMRREAAVQELFAVSGLRVGERVLHVTENKGKLGLDFAETTLKLNYQDDRPVSGEWPLMGEVQTNIKET